MPTKSFKGKIASATVETIPLSTNNGSTGYRIKKLQVFPELPTSTSTEAMFKIFSVPQPDPSVTLPTADVDFSDNTLLAMAYYSASGSSENYPDDMTIVFDNMTFNQDIYLTMRNVQSGNNPLNYYIELEQVKLSLDENTVATLKDIRNIKEPL